MGRRWATSVVAVVLVVAATPASAASKTGGGATSTTPRWGASIPVSTLNPDPTRGSQLVDLATNPSGVTVAAWEQYTYSGSGSSSIGVAVETGGRWSGPTTVSPSATPFALVPSVAVSALGDLAVSWTAETSTTTTSPATALVQVAVRRAGSASWVTTTLDTEAMSGGQRTEAVPVAFDGVGNLTATWTWWDGSHNSVKAAGLPAGAGPSGWATPTVVSANVDAWSPSLAVDARGEAAVAYLGTTPTNSTAVAQLVSRAGAGGGWSPAPATVSETIDSSVGYVQVPKVVLDSAGRPTVMYRALGSGIEVNRPNPDGSWPVAGTMVIPQPVPGATLGSPDVAVDDNGNAFVVVSIFDPTINVDRASVWVNELVGGRWLGPQRLTDPAAGVDAYATRIAASSDGALVMVGWVDHFHGVVQSAAWTGSAWAAATTIGKGVAWAAFQDQFRLVVGSKTVARAAWKATTRQGLQVVAADYQG